MSRLIFRVERRLFAFLTYLLQTQQDIFKVQTKLCYWTNLNPEDLYSPPFVYLFILRTGQIRILQAQRSAETLLSSLAQEEEENECESGEKKLLDEHHRFSLVICWAQLIGIFYNRKMLGTILICNDCAVLKMNT